MRVEIRIKTYSMDIKLCILSIYVIYFFSVTAVPLTSKESDAPKCGYQACHPTKNHHVNVHLVPHSHDDVGWLKTVNEYYYGLQNYLYDAGVQYIYDTTAASLRRSTDRKFIYVETAYFWKWWQEQNEQVRKDLKELVNNGQLEFVGGGWSMNDEAVTNYQSIIDQMTWGLRRLNDTFGPCAVPKMGWQIDPFGHSSEMASIFAGLGFDGVLLGRIDFQDQETRSYKRTMEMVWRGSNSLGSASDLFAGVLYNHYDAPYGFNFGGDVDPLIDDPTNINYNIADRADDFLANYVLPATLNYTTSNILIPMGSDFAYQNAEKWYTNMDRLIKYINGKVFNGTRYNVMYSTPSCYVYAVHSETKGNLSAPLKTDDFFPYASDKDSYWTGYFTSRPSLKKFERVGNSILQSCKQLAALANLTSEKSISKLNSLREAMGVMQHHDAVTGTETEVVSYDYARLLNQGIKECENISSEALSKLTHQKSTFKQCLLTNISDCTISEREDIFVVTLHNTLSRHVSKYVRLPVFGSNFSIKSISSGEAIPWQLVPVAEALLVYPGRKSNATKELVFEMKNIPPLGVKSYFVKKLDHAEIKIVPEKIDIDSGVVEVTNKDQNISLYMNIERGTLEKVTMNGIHMELHQNFYYYKGYDGMSESDPTRPSGAYVFRPIPNDPIGHFKRRVNFTIYKGELVTEIHQYFNSWITQIITLYKDKNYVEFNWMVGPMPVDYSYGKEVITRFTTNLQSNSTFYTDSNSRGMLKRIKNRRPTWNLMTSEPISSNYYPVTSKIAIEDVDKDIGLVLLTDRGQGGSSLSDGELELMLNRFTVADDQLGVNEVLMETAYNQGLVARGQIHLMVGRMKGNGSVFLEYERNTREENLMEAQMFLSVPEDEGFEEYNQMEIKGITKSLPKNVHIMTLEPWKDSSFLLRLEHLYEINEHPELSKPAVVNLQDLFTTVRIRSIRETTLGANQWLEENHRLKFNSRVERTNITTSITQDDNNNDKNGNLKVTLKPQQIRTFVVEVV